MDFFFLERLIFWSDLKNDSTSSFWQLNLNKIQEQFKIQFPALEDFIIGPSIPTLYRVRFFSSTHSVIFIIWCNNGLIFDEIIFTCLSLFEAGWSLTTHILKGWGEQCLLHHYSSFLMHPKLLLPVSPDCEFFITYEYTANRSSIFSADNVWTCAIPPGLLCQGRAPSRQASHELCFPSSPVPSLCAMQEGCAPSGRERSL